MNKARCADEDSIPFLIASPRAASATEAARVQPRRADAPAHDAFTRLLHRLEPDPATLWHEVEPQVERRRGVLVVDDSTLDKPYAKKMALVHRHWSGKHHRVVDGINLITLLWTDGDDYVPCDWRVCDKPHDGQTKNDHLAAMLLTAKQRGFAPECVLFDRWYAAIDNLRLVRNAGWRWLTQLRSNRKVNINRQGYRYVRDCAISETGTNAWVEGYGLVRLFRIVAPDGEAEYWATNDVEMDAVTRLEYAEMSWGIEVYHRTLKQECHAEHAMVRAGRAQRNHGAGRLASSRLYPCLHTLPVTLAAVCDLDRDKAERNAAKFGGQAVYTDYEQMVARENLDAVMICVGPDWHSRLAIAVMEAGLPVYTEKPPAISSADSLKMRETSRRRGVICMTGFKKRFAPAYRKAKEAATSAAFGGPSLLSIDYACGPTYTNEPGNFRKEFLLDFTVHILDISRYLAGEVAEVYAATRDRLTYAVHLRFTNGALGVLALSANREWLVPTEKVELTGGPGQFLSVDNSVSYVRYSGSEIAEWHSPSFSTARGDSLVETGFQGELAEFVAAVREGREPESSIASSHETMRLYEAIRDSAASGRPVAIEHEGRTV